MAKRQLQNSIRVNEERPITSDDHVRLAIAKSARYRRTVMSHKK